MKVLCGRVIQGIYHVVWFLWFQVPIFVFNSAASLTLGLCLCAKDIMFDSKARRTRDLKQSMNKARTYKRWYTFAKQADDLNDVSEWCEDIKCSEYDWFLIKARLQSLRECRERGDIDSLALHLRSGLMRNLGGISNQKLFSRSPITTKRLIEDYEKEISDHLRYLCDSWISDPSANTLEKFDYFYEARQAYGRSALLLSGGAGFGIYHLGVVKTLFEQKLLPRIIAGTSVGSLIASLVAVRTDEELPGLFQPGAINLDIFERLESKGSLRRKLKRFWDQGVLMDVALLQDCLRSNIGDYTFQEVYDRTRRILNITASGTKKYNYPIVMNYLTTPNVLVWSAAVASCAVPGLFLSVELKAKDHKGRIVPYHISSVKWADGSLESDLPMERIAELFNVTNFIVSQVNPHIIPFVNSEVKENTSISLLFELIKDEVRHRAAQLTKIGLLPRYLASDIFNQKYAGHITIVPPLNVEDYLNIISNPNALELQRAMREGGRVTWPKLCQIKSQRIVEQMLEDCVRRMRIQMQETGMGERNRSARNLTSMGELDEEEQTQ